MTEQDAADTDVSSGATSPDANATDGHGEPEADATTGESDAEASADADEAASRDTDAVIEDAVDEDLVDRVADGDPRDIAREIASLRTRVDGLEGELDAREEEIDELESKLKRKQADFQNYKKRMEKRREEEQRRATEDLVTRLLDVRDNLKRALDQDEDVDIRDGVDSTLRQFDDELAAENVDVIEPEPGEDVDPHRHEVLVRVDSDQPEDTIAEVHRPGYVMADAVLREAQVTVSDGTGE